MCEPYDHVQSVDLTGSQSETSGPESSETYKITITSLTKDFVNKMAAQCCQFEWNGMRYFMS